MIENTETRDPLLHVAVAAGALPGYVEQMEAEGQAQLVASEQLPVELEPDQAAFEAAGFTLGPPTPRDPLFRAATLPPGWRKEPSDHDMWSHVVDELGRRRVAIFYKAAFYDRRANARLISPSSYLADCLYNEHTPIFDDTWVTPEIAAQEFEALLQRELTEHDDIERSKRLAEDPATSSVAHADVGYWTGRLARSDARLVELTAMIERLQTGGQR